MGSWFCKPRKPGSKTPEDAGKEIESENEENSAKESRGIERMRKTLRDDVELFLLNNILMSVQFFENYENDIERLRRDYATEEELPEHKMKFFEVDAIQALVDSRVSYQPKHGAQKENQQFLQPWRMCTSYSNIEASFGQARFGPTPNIKPYYKLLVDNCENVKRQAAGYVNLVESESIEEEGIYEEIGGESTLPETKDSKGINPTETLPSQLKAREAPLDAEVVRRHTSVRRVSARKTILKSRMSYAQPLRPELIRKALLSVPAPSESCYGYTKIRDLTKPHPLVEVRLLNIPRSSCSLPRFCFRKMEMKNVNDKRRVGFAMDGKPAVVSYNKPYYLLSSEQFRGHFCDVFVERLAEPLGFEEKNVNEATLQGAQINCKKNETFVQVTPVIPLETWPICADSFLRPRLAYGEEAWPRVYMQTTIKEMGCLLVPLGYIQRKEKNPDYDREWRIECPKGEKYLLLHMMHAHVRCYLFALLIYRAFLVVETEELNFGPHHLLHHLFWEVRRDFYAWPDDRPGETFYKFLTALYTRIQNEKLRDFFFHKRNLFENSSLKILHRVQCRLKLILENPVAYVLLAVKNLKFQPGFYTPLDCSKLFKIITEKNIIQHKHPETAPEKKKRRKKKNEEEDLMDEERQFRRELKKQKESEKAAQKLFEESRKSVETIKVEERPVLDERQALGGEKADTLHILDQTIQRRQDILTYFIPHFITMAVKSHEYKAHAQARMYLLHAQKLTQLLAEEHAEEADVKTFRKSIEALKVEYSVKDDGDLLQEEEGKDEKYSRTEAEVPNFKRELPHIPNKEEKVVASVIKASATVHDENSAAEKVDDGQSNFSKVQVIVTKVTIEQEKNFEVNEKTENEVELNEVKTNAEVGKKLEINQEPKELETSKETPKELETSKETPKELETSKETPKELESNKNIKIEADDNRIALNKMGNDTKSTREVKNNAKTVRIQLIDSKSEKVCQPGEVEEENKIVTTQRDEDAESSKTKYENSDSEEDKDTRL